MKLFIILAELVLMFHLAWIIWILFGWFLTRRRPWLAALHVASLVWGICVEVGPWPCPLTWLEQWLETDAGSASYQGSFLIHYLEAFVYPDVPPLLLTWLGSGVCIAILAIYVKRIFRDHSGPLLRRG